MRNNNIEKNTSNSGINNLCRKLFSFKSICNSYFNPCMKIKTAFVMSNDNFLRRIECVTLAHHFILSFSLTAFGHVIKTKYHVLGRNSDRSTVSRVEDV